MELVLLEGDEAASKTRKQYALCSDRTVETTQVQIGGAGVSGVGFAVLRGCCTSSQRRWKDKAGDVWERN